MSPDDAALIEATARLADHIETLANAIQAAAETIATAIRQVPAAPEMTAQGSVQ